MRGHQLTHIEVYETIQRLVIGCGRMVSDWREPRSELPS